MGEFQTSLGHEVKTFSWRIQDFSKVVELGLPGPSLYFDAGQSLGMPSRWKLEILEDDDSGIQFLRFRCAEGRNKNVKMECEVSIKRKEDPTKDLFTLRSSSQSKFREALGTWKNLQKKACLIDDALIIHVKFSLYRFNATNNLDEITKKMVEASQSEICNHLGSLLDSGVDTDFLIQVKNESGTLEEIMVHKVILARSPVFQRMLDSEMVERETGSMIIEDLSPQGVKIMIKWIYSGILDEGWKNIPDQLIMAADKYELALLKGFLDDNLHHVVNFENARDCRRLAEMAGMTTAVKNVTNFMKLNVEKFL